MSDSYMNIEAASFPNPIRLKLRPSVLQDPEVPSRKIKKKSVEESPVPQSNGAIPLKLNDPQLRKQIISRFGEEFFHIKKIEMPWKSTKTFIQLTRLIPADKFLSEGAVKLATILSLFDIHGRSIRRLKVAPGRVFPSLNTLSHAMQKSTPTVEKYIRELVKWNYLYIKRRFNASNIYVMHIPLFHSVEEIVDRYHVISCPLSAADFIVDHHTQPAGLASDIKKFFKFAREITKKNREKGNSGEKALTIEEMEKEALRVFRKWVPLDDE
jgi:hypothetical protein